MTEHELIFTEDRQSKVIIIGQDPAADENVARRILVGSAGQRVELL